MRSISILLLLSACAPSYWMTESELHRARFHDRVRAVDDAGDPVLLRAEKLDDAAVTPEGDGVRVRPWNARYKAAAGLLTVGTILAAASLGAFLSQLAPCHGDEVCWLPQTIAGGTLGAFSGVSFLIGSALLPSGLDDTLAR